MKDLLDFKDTDEYNSYMSKVNHKIEKSLELTKEEIDNFCFALPYDKKSKFTFCNDDRFNYLFLHKLDNGKTRPMLTSSQLTDLESLVNEWKVFLNEKNKKTRIDQQIKEEYKYEMENLRNDFKNLHLSPETNKQFTIKEKEIIGYNKYIYLKGIDIFSDYEFPIKMIINSKTILIDESILFHSLIRHYGEILKQTSAQKSFFSEDVLVEDLYNLILDLLKSLKEKNLNVENLISIKFIYKSKYYQLYTKKIKINERVIEYKVNSFFPIEDEAILKEIKDNYSEQILNSNFIYLNRNVSTP
jgi:hypothetical protein